MSIEEKCSKFCWSRSPKIMKSSGYNLIVISNMDAAEKPREINENRSLLKHETLYKENNCIDLRVITLHK